MDERLTFDYLKNYFENMKKYLLFAVLLIGGILINGQQKIMLTGQVKDEKTKENLIFTTVAVYHNMDSLVTGGVTNDKGYFNLPVQSGDYKIVISNVAYESDTIETGMVYADQFLGVIKLKQSDKTLDEHQVKGSAINNSLDKDVYIITDAQKDASNDTKNVLDKISGVSYDRYGGALKVDNNDNIIVLVNGVEKDQEYIKNLPPDRLLKVEIIRDPGGRYGLEGYSAVINVILKDDYIGSEFYFKEQPIVDLDTKNIEELLLINDVYLSYNYTHNKLNVYGAFSNHFNKFPFKTSSVTIYNDGLKVVESPINGNNTIINSLSSNYTFGVDYKFNPKHSLSFESNISALPLESSINTFNYTTDVLSNDTLIDSYDFETETKSNTFSSYNSLFYVGKFDEKNELNMNFTYSSYKSDFDTKTKQTESYNRKEFGVNKKQYTRFNVELTHVLTKKSSVQVGYGNTWKLLNNKYNVDYHLFPSNTDVNSTVDFEYTDFRNKLYAYYSWKKRRSFGVKIGAAGEHSTPRSGSTKLSYLVIQPLLDVKYSVNKMLNFKLKYRASSDYPSISQVNPFVSQLNPRAISKGNPFLRPSLVHKLSLRMNIMQGLASIEPYYHYSDTRITQVGSLHNSGIFEYNMVNAELYEKKGILINLVIPFSKKLILQNSYNFFDNKIEHGDLTNNFTEWTGSSKLIYIMDSINTVTGLIYQKENIKHISGLGYSKQNTDFWLLFVQKQIFKEKGSIMLGYFLPLDFGVNYNQGGETSAPGFSLTTKADITLVKNIFLIEFSYRFNKGKKVRKTEKDIEKESEGGGGGFF